MLMLLLSMDRCHNEFLCISVTTSYVGVKFSMDDGYLNDVCISLALCHICLVQLELLPLIKKRKFRGNKEYDFS